MNTDDVTFDQRGKNFLQDIIEQFGSYDKAIHWYRANLESDPINCRLNLQVLLNAMGEEEAAFSVSDQIVGIAPRDPRGLFNRGWHLIKRGQFSEGFALLENGRQLGTYGNAPLNSKQKNWSQDCRDENVIFVSEGGLGDEIINVRFVKELVSKYGCRVIVSCHPSLASIFARIPEVSAVVQREACLGVYHNSWLPAMSAIHRMGIEPYDLRGSSYLHAHPGYIERWRQTITTMTKAPIKIGIRWAGNPRFEHQQLRKFPPGLLLDLRHIPGVQLFSFQKDNDLLDLPPEVTDLSSLLSDWEDTAAALLQMNLVISSCTSVAHMSAALGQRTWIIVPSLPYYPWALPGERSPWYDSIRLIRQMSYGDWQSVAAELRLRLILFDKNAGNI